MCRTYAPRWISGRWRESRLATWPVLWRLVFGTDPPPPESLAVTSPSRQYIRHEPWRRDNHLDSVFSYRHVTYNEDPHYTYRYTNLQTNITQHAIRPSTSNTNTAVYFKLYIVANTFAKDKTFTWFHLYNGFVFVHSLSRYTDWWLRINVLLIIGVQTSPLWDANVWNRKACY